MPRFLYENMLGDYARTGPLDVPNPGAWPTDPGGRDPARYLSDEYNRRRRDPSVNQRQGVWFMPGLWFLTPSPNRGWDVDDCNRAYAMPAYRYLSALRQAAGRGYNWGSRPWPLADTIPPELEAIFPDDPDDVWDWMWIEWPIEEHPSGAYPPPDDKSWPANPAFWVQAYMQAAATEAGKQAALMRGASAPEAAAAGAAADRGVRETAFTTAKNEIANLHTKVMASKRDWGELLSAEADRLKGIIKVLDPFGLAGDPDDPNANPWDIFDRIKRVLIIGGIGIGAIVVLPPLLNVIGNLTKR